MAHIENQLLLWRQISYTFFQNCVIMFGIYFSLNRIGTLDIRILVPVPEQIVSVFFIIICSFQVIVCTVAAEGIDIAVRVGEFVRSSFVFDETDKHILSQILCQMRIMEHFDEKSVTFIPVFFK